MAVALDLHISSASFGTSLSQWNQTHLFVRLIDRRPQDGLAFFEVVWDESTYQVNRVSAPARYKQIREQLQSRAKGGHIRIDISNTIDRSQLSNNGGWRLDPAAYRRQRHICEIVNVVEWMSCMRWCS